VQRVRLVNGAMQTISRVHLAIHLPAGTVPRDVRAEMPAAAPGGTPGPVLGEDNEGRMAAVSADSLAPGETMMLALDTQPARKSLLPLLVGCALGLLYLVRQRGLVGQQQAGAAAR
jgi:hypothetical protein